MTNKELPKAYIPKDFEDLIYKKWLDDGFFNPDVCVLKNICKQDAQVFSVMMPPPNVTGVLHLGHAFENTIMDTQTRYKRMLGYKTLWLPGTDHAAVATQARVEKKLIEEEGYKDPRKELGREKLLQIIREFAENSKTTIINQIKKLGASCDWSRLAYTFDETRSKTVNEIFVRMYNDKLIYKGYKVVNWSVKGQCTCSDDELVYIPRKTKLYTFKYQKDFPILIATTRPETKLGDTAVAVNPNDDRYKKYIGQTFIVDVLANEPRKIKIISDDSIDPNYGTGALGVTPAHSIIDFEMAQKNNLELIQIIGQNGKMTQQAGQNYQDLTPEEARVQFVEYLKQNDLLLKEEDIEQNVSISDRFKDIVEPLPMTQWFVDVNKKIANKNKSLKDLMKEAVTIGHNNDLTKKISILPNRFEKTYFTWIDNLRDWCISRQIWWGHQMPVWYHNTTGELYVATTPPQNINEYTQEKDTLDTWFSSGTWTFSTLGWPENTTDLQTYHSTTWMQMGYEILFFWMARMILMTTYALNDIPFKDVYIHGMVRDKQGQKFSKSLGNGIDPIDMINIYGTDALRLSLIADITPGQDSRFYEEKVEHYRNFVNKLWNISRFIMMNVNDISHYSKININSQNLTQIDKWILIETDKLILEVTNLLNSYNFSLALDKLKEFTWNKFADNYIEMAKIEGNKDTILTFVLQTILRLWHPFAPFITEHIWSFIQNKPIDSIIVEAWPTQKNIVTANEHQNILKEFNLLTQTITAIRNARLEKKVSPSLKVDLIIKNYNSILELKNNENLLKGLAKINTITQSENNNINTYAFVVENIELKLKLDSIIDLQNTGEQKEKLNKEIETLKKYIDSINTKLSNLEFTQKAPQNIIQKEEEKLKTSQQKLEVLMKILGN